MKETDITPLFHTRWCFLLMILVAVGGTAVAYLTGNISYFSDNDGFLFPSSDCWISGRLWSLCTGIGVSILCAVLVNYLNKNFNIIRHITWLFAGLFILMQGAYPSVMGQLYDGTLMCAMLLLAIVPLFTAFQDAKATRRVFLSFCIVSFGSLFDIAFVGYMAVLLVGCLQMQCLKLKSFLALVLGILTPYWMVVGFGFVALSDIRIPEFVGIFSSVPKGEVLLRLVYAGLTMFLGAVAGILNLIKVYSYNARTRAYNGFFLVLFFMSCILALADYRRFAVYLPIINLSSAFQIGHFFVINGQKRAYIPLTLIIAAYIAIYWWSILM